MSLSDEGASWKVLVKSMYSEESKYKVFIVKNMSAGVWHVDASMDYCDITLSLDIKEEQALSDALFPNYVLSNLEYALNDNSSYYGKNYNFTLSTSPDTSVRVKSTGVYTAMLRFIEGDFTLSAVLRDGKTEKDNFTVTLSNEGTFNLKIGSTIDEFNYAPICGYAGKYYGFYCN